MVFSVVVTVLAFGVMIILHELGHFISAKKFGVTVHEFSIGMGPLLFKWGKGETQYSLRLLPFGGFVRLEGEEEESDNPRAFSNIHPLKRICILAAGAFMNVLLGFVCFMLINNIHGYVRTSTLAAVEEGSPAYEAGLEAGDRIVKMGKTKINTADDIALFFADKTDSVELTYVRDGKKHTLTLTPDFDENTGECVTGFVQRVKKLKFGETFAYSYYDTRFVVKAVFVSLKMLFTGEAKVSDMSGPVGIVQTVDQTTQAVAATQPPLYVFLNLLNLFAMISVNLGVFNLLPFPALDGGSIIFAAAELVSRKKLKQEILGYINLAGLVLIMGLGIFVMFSDIMKFF